MTDIPDNPLARLAREIERSRVYERCAEFALFAVIFAGGVLLAYGVTGQ